MFKLFVIPTSSKTFILKDTKHKKHTNLFFTWFLGKQKQNIYEVWTNV